MFGWFKKKEEVEEVVEETEEPKIGDTTEENIITYCHQYKKTLKVIFKNGESTLTETEFEPNVILDQRHFKDFKGITYNGDEIFKLEEIHREVSRIDVQFGFMEWTYRYTYRGYGDQNHWEPRTRWRYLDPTEENLAKYPEKK